MDFTAIPAGWLIQLFIIYFSYGFIFWLRKNQASKSEYKKQLIVACIFLAIAFIGEVIGINLKLWTYFPDNWPITVWIGYFGIGLLAYQLAKFIDERIA